jgi:hypothetical protein
MAYGVQFRGTLQPHASGRWFTFGWPANQDYAWMVVPTTVQSGAPHVQWDVAVERASPTAVTYWLTITNVSNDAFDFEARYNAV